MEPTSLTGGQRLKEDAHHFFATCGCSFFCHVWLQLFLARDLRIDRHRQMGASPARPSSQQEAEPLSLICGPPPTPHRHNTSSVLLIGDSISMGALESLDGDEMGYGAAVSRMLERMGAVHVQHNGGWSDGGQAGPSSNGVRCIRHWLGQERWDVVHANFGLHDIAKARG